MEQFIDVPVDQVAVGDQVKVDGYGAFFAKNVTNQSVQLNGLCWETVVDTHPMRVTIRDGGGEATFRRSSIVSCRRRKPEPEPKPGDWQCVQWTHQMSIRLHSCDKQHGCRVYRASGGWSPDTRTGRPWVMREEDTVEIKLHGLLGT